MNLKTIKLLAFLLISMLAICQATTVDFYDDEQIIDGNSRRRKIMKKKILLIIIVSFFFLSGNANSQVVFQENFENAPLNQPYPWNGSNNDNWYTGAYNRAIPISDFPEHSRDFLGDNILYINAGESYHIIPSQTLPVRFKYDLLFHYSDQSPSGYGAVFSQNIIVNRPELRSGIIDLHIQEGYSYYFTQQDGIYWSENEDANWHRVGEIIPDTWYHVERTLNPTGQIENIKLINRDTLQEFNFTYEIITPLNSIEGFTLAADYSPSYSLVDNLVIETIPEPSTLFLLALGFGLLRKRV
jgi:hypothetical protein